MLTFVQATQILAFSLPIFAVYYMKKRDSNYINKYFEHKNIIITGASQGIGKHLSETLTKYKCKQFLLARSFDNESSGNIIKYKCDCSDFETVSKVINKICNNFGNPNILINCAGAGDWKYITEMSPIEIKSCIDAPLMSSIWTSRSVLNNISKNDNLQIIFIQSPTVIQPWKSTTAYTISRWGMQGFIEALRTDYYNTKIKIKDVILGKVNSQYFVNNPVANTRLPLLSKLIPTLSLENTSQIIIKSIINNNNTTIEPFMIRLLSYIHWISPALITSVNNYLDC